MVGNLPNQLNRITIKYLENNIDLRPVISIQAGTRIQLSLITDIEFKPIRQNRQSYSEKKNNVSK